MFRAVLVLRCRGGRTRINGVHVAEIRPPVNSLGPFVNLAKGQLMPGAVMGSAKYAAQTLVDPLPSRPLNQNNQVDFQEELLQESDEVDKSSSLDKLLLEGVVQPICRWIKQMSKVS